MKKKYLYLIAIFIILAGVLAKYNYNKHSNIPVVAIANYGPHSSLNATINGFKAQMQDEGFIENNNVRYETLDVSFDPGLIPQMIVSLKGKNPKVTLALTTPVAQMAKNKIQDIPVVYAAITDPVEAGLIKDKYKSNNNVTGSADTQDIKSLLKFALSILPSATRVGVLYATSEANDSALVKMMQDSAAEIGLSVLAIPIEQPRDVQTRMQEFKDKVDFIYVGTSGPIQPTLPVISAEAKKMNIPLFNVEEQAVKDGLALASFGVNYLTVGKNAGKIVAAILKGEKVENLPPLYPKFEDHHGVINQKNAQKLGIVIPDNIDKNIEIIKQ